MYFWTITLYNIALCFHHCLNHTDLEKNSSMYKILKLSMRTSSHAYIHKILKNKVISLNIFLIFRDFISNAESNETIPRVTAN